jgi:hypothetical protein
VEAIGTATRFLLNRAFNRIPMGNTMTSIFFTLDGLSSGFRLPNQFCYTHRHYFNSFRNFRVFSIHIYQLYPSFWAVYFGHAFHPDVKILPPLPKLTNPVGLSILPTSPNPVGQSILQTSRSLVGQRILTTSPNPVGLSSLPISPKWSLWHHCIIQTDRELYAVRRLPAPLEWK